MYWSAHDYDCSAKIIFLGDTLYYRIPGRDKKRLNGRFTEIEDFSTASGFVLSSFDKTKLYSFNQDDLSSELHNYKTVLDCSSKESYVKSANWFLSELQARNLAKAVLSRIKDVPFDYNPISLYEKLCKVYPDAFVYLISSPLFGTWIGATPEVLLEVAGTDAKTMALAGTLRTNDSTEWNEKEKNEQNFVSSFIKSQLSKSGIKKVQECPRENLVAGPVTHLKTEFTFDLADCSVGNIALALHPTPAVCGLPQDNALDLIYEAEEHNRSLYAGFIGVIGEDTSSLYVNLRCAHITTDKAYLFLGGGFTKDSDVESEWQETENKAKTLLNVIENL